jgi:hypothetical protein
MGLPRNTHISLSANTKEGISGDKKTKQSKTKQQNTPKPPT